MSVKEQLLDAGKSFEVLLTLKNEQSKKVAWQAVSVMVVITLMSLGALYISLLLNKTIVVPVMIDKSTGRSETYNSVVVDNISQQTAQDKYFASLYVNLRERYNYYSSQADYDIVPIYSSEAVAAEYIEFFAGPKAPDKVYQDAANVVTIDIISNPVVEANFPDKVATIRFAKHIKNLRSGQVKTEYDVARVTFRMVPPKVMTEEIRTTNPLGFTVVEYLVEKEMRGGE
ncbi:type IV secretion system protein [Pseudomonas amygdali pv. morsprunorum]|uniref:virB8 family protein n=1 Tax=Pseudomonas amygdali TaxID=47877 RepID=UPI00288D2CB3|nr:type IV secretion system protein [Pseudomonas amygdali]MDT3268699.1 type IV secretion system protein [Pseudomonas amygdali pv. morsprunorum]